MSISPCTFKMTEVEKINYYSTRKLHHVLHINMINVITILNVLYKSDSRENVLMKFCKFKATRNYYFSVM